MKPGTIKAWAIAVGDRLGQVHLSPFLSAYQIFDQEPQEFISSECRVVEVEIRVLTRAERPKRKRNRK